MLVSLYYLVETLTIRDLFLLNRNGSRRPKKYRALEKEAIFLPPLMVSASESIHSSSQRWEATMWESAVSARSLKKRMGVTE